MNEFIEAAQNLSEQLLPILGVAVLICLMIFLIHLTRTVKSLNKTIDKTSTTVDLANQSIEKAQAPLDTVVKISKTVDSVHDAAVNAVKTTKDYVVTNFDEIKNKYFNKEQKEKETREPSPDDIIND